jgi:RNA polymerase sigma factor (sigma-70 family)
MYQACMSESEKSQEGEGKLEELFGLFEAPLLGYARKLIRNEETAQDIVQEAFIRLNGRIGEVEHPRAWLYRTVHNLAVTHVRKIGVWGSTGEEAIAECRDPAPLPDARLERMEEMGLARICIERMEERKRELLRMKFEEGLSYKEMAARTGLSAGNVGYLIHHALRELAGELEKMGVTS